MLEELDFHGRAAALGPSRPDGARRPPLVALLLTAVVAAFGFAQLAGQLGVPLPAALERLYAEGGVGYDALFMAGDWLSPWKSQLIHGGPLHLLPNLAVIAVMSWRLERALGPATLLLVAAVSVATGTLAIALLEDLPAVGSSVLAFGLWGAVLATGLRSDRGAGPLARRALLDPALFAVLFGASTLSPGTTLIGHVSGLLGGATVALLAPAAPPGGAPPDRRQAAIDTVLALFFALAPGLLGASIGAFPGVVGGPRVPTPVAGLPAPLALPTRMARHPTEVDGLRGWRTSSASEAVLYAGVQPTSATGIPAAPTRSWRLELEPGGRLIADEAGQRWAGWRNLAWRVIDPTTGRTVDRIEEHLRRVPGGIQRVGWRLGAADEPHRRALFDSVLAPLATAP